DLNCRRRISLHTYVLLYLLTSAPTPISSKHTQQVATPSQQRSGRVAEDQKRQHQVELSIIPPHAVRLHSPVSVRTDSLTAGRGAALFSGQRRAGDSSRCG
ncbi:unnamed protein product, partial [Pleuronectes platessa]